MDDKLLALLDEMTEVKKHYSKSTTVAGDTKLTYEDLINAKNLMGSSSRTNKFQQEYMLSMDTAKEIELPSVTLEDIDEIIKKI